MWIATKTWVAGDPWTSTDVNQYFRDDLYYLRGDPQWMYPSLMSGWNNFGQPYQSCSFRRQGDRVKLRGMVKQNSAPPAAYISGQGNPPNPGTNRIFVLPPGWRPPYAIAFYCIAQGGGVRIDVYPGGAVCTVVQISTSTAWQFIDLTAIQFSLLP